MKTYGFDSLLNVLDEATRTPHAIRVKTTILRALAEQVEAVTVVRGQNEYIGQLQCVYYIDKERRFERFELRNTNDNRVMVEFHADEVYCISVYGNVCICL